MTNTFVLKRVWHKGTPGVLRVMTLKCVNVLGDGLWSDLTVFAVMVMVLPPPAQTV